MLHVLAFITAQPGRREELLAAFNANVPAVRAERGCIEYGAAVDAPGFGGFAAEIGPDTFVVIEKWADRDALTDHGVAPHMRAYATQTKGLLANRTIHVLA